MPERYVELSVSELLVLRLLAAIPRPLGYFGLVARLELDERRLQSHLLPILDRLCATELVALERLPGYRIGAYSITERGRTFLREEFGDEL